MTTVCAYLLSFPKYNDILVENSDFFIPHIFNALVQEEDSVGISSRPIHAETLESRGLVATKIEKNDGIICRFSRIRACDRRTDRRQDGFGIASKTMRHKLLHYEAMM